MKSTLKTRMKIVLSQEEERRGEWIAYTFISRYEISQPLASNLNEKSYSSTKFDAKLLQQFKYSDSVDSGKV